MTHSLVEETVFVGVDWADQLHAWHLRSSKTEDSGLLQQDAGDIKAWVKLLRDKHFQQRSRRTYAPPPPTALQTIKSPTV